MIETFTNFERFEAEAKKLGVEVDLRALLTLDFLFLEQYKDFVILSLRDYEKEPSNIVILSLDKNLMYSGKEFADRDFRMFSYTIQKKYGESSVLTYLVSKAVLESYTKKFEELNDLIDEFEAGHELDRFEDTSISLRKTMDRVEDFLNILITLEERKIRQVNTAFISYDYELLISRTRHLLDRCRNHVNQLRDIRTQIEMRSTIELNKRIERLTDIMKKLTALTLIFMIPNIIASHFGMNFKFMPELSMPEAYPAVIIGSLAISIGAALYMKKIGWL
ncbi:magnesium transporter CorA family protein [Candidatus Micrarchaeota archaeon]|nr:magnesium transporter CorA family protein [Candidatus Micrarchaeota archaeon]